MVSNYFNCEILNVVKNAERWQKMAHLLLPKGWLCVSVQKQMCHLCGWLKLFLKNVRWEKIKIQKLWQCGRLSIGSIVPLRFYVLLCRSFYALSSFRLAGNDLRLGVVADF